YHAHRSEWRRRALPVGVLRQGGWHQRTSARRRSVSLVGEHRCVLWLRASREPERERSQERRKHPHTSFGGRLQRYSKTDCVVLLADRFRGQALCSRSCCSCLYCH